MAMRQRGSGYGTTRFRQSNRPIYEDFQPVAETKEEEGAQIVVFRLPGFLKEQIKLTAVHYQRLIKINGERPLGNNRWSRFKQTIPIPTNCDVNKVHSKFHDGTLTVILTKEVITSPTKNVAEDHKASQSLSPPRPELAASDNNPPKGQQQLVEEQQPKKEKKVQDQGLPPKAVDLDAENYGKQKNDHKGIGDDHPLSSTWKGQEGNFPPTAADDSKQKGIGTISDKNQILDHGKAKVNKDENEGKISVLQDPKEGSSSGLPKKKKQKESGTASMNMRESAEKGIKSVAEERVKDEDEQRKLIVNMGAAVLVLAAFVAYVSSGLFGSLGKTKNQ